MRVLLTTDGSKEAGSAAAFLRLLPLPRDSAIQVVNVIHNPLFRGGASDAGLPGQLWRYERDRADRLVRDTVDSLKQPGVEVGPAVRIGDPATELLLAAGAFEAELVVVGSKGLTGHPRSLLGSVARCIATCAACPVLVARQPRHGLAMVVVATDGSSHANTAVAFAAGFPLPGSTRFALVHVVSPYEPHPGLYRPGHTEFESMVEQVRQRQKDAGRQDIAAARAVLGATGRTMLEDCRIGDPANEIGALAKETNADLIIVGARGSSLTEALPVGSVADRLLSHAECSVLIVR